MIFSFNEAPAIANKALVAFTVVGTAFAADGPAHFSEWLEVSPALVRGAFFGALLFALNQPGTLRQRLVFFITGFSLAYLLADVLAHSGIPGTAWLGVRGWSFMLAFFGFYIVNILKRFGQRAEDRADDAADTALDRVMGMMRGGADEIRPK